MTTLIPLVTPPPTHTHTAQMNRPFGAVDVSANLKGSVPKAAAQKILVALAERGQLVQKTCGQYILLSFTYGGVPRRLGASERRTRHAMHRHVHEVSITYRGVLDGEPDCRFSPRA